MTQSIETCGQSTRCAVENRTEGGDSSGRRGEKIKKHVWGARYHNDIYSSILTFCGVCTSVHPKGSPWLVLCVTMPGVLLYSVRSSNSGEPSKPRRDLRARLYHYWHGVYRIEKKCGLRYIEYRCKYRCLAAFEPEALRSALFKSSACPQSELRRVWPCGSSFSFGNRQI